jgi:2-phospho-L-lactate guanylyltransferase
MRATAIIPVKRFGFAKQRLLEPRPPATRGRLVKAMLSDVLAATTAPSWWRGDRCHREGAPSGSRFATHSAPPRRSRFSRPQDTGHPEAATLGIIRAKALGAECVALLPGDCRSSTRRARRGARADATESRDDRARPSRQRDQRPAALAADAIGPAFGPDSCARHADRARRLGHELASSSSTRCRSTSTRPTTSPRWPRSWSASRPRPGNGGVELARGDGAGVGATDEPQGRDRAGAPPARDHNRRAPGRADRRGLASAGEELSAADVVAVAQKASPRLRAGAPSWRRGGRRSGASSPPGWARTRAWSS